MAVVDNMARVKKHHVWYFFNNGTTETPDWVRIEKSTESTITMNGETEVFDYIADESPTTVLSRYAPGFSHPVTAYKGNPDFEMLFDLFYNMQLDAKANKDFLIVFMNEEPESEKWAAWAGNALLVVDSADWVAGIVTVSVTTNGTVKKGTVVITDGEPVFTETVPEEPVNP